MSGSGKSWWGGDLYHSDMGDVKGGSVEFDKGGPGNDHHTVYGDGFHFSWDSDRSGDISDVHGTDHSTGDKHD